MALTKTDLNRKEMKSEHGTVCLITQAGRADELLDLAHRRIVNETRLVKQPLDAWDI
jgi:hypothetical protein